MDASGHAISIYERLKETFGSSEVFLDTAGMQAGSRWQEETRAQLESCEVCVVIIGRQWAPERLGGREDLVRFELETALNGNKALIPVLVDNAELPGVNELPPSLRSLLSWQAVWLDHRTYGAYKQDLSTLVDRIRALFMQRGVYGVIRVYRWGHVPGVDSIFTGGRSNHVSILIDGSPVAEISPTDNLAFQIPVGPHTVQMLAKDLQSELIQYQIQRGDLKCLRCDVSLGDEYTPPKAWLEDVLPYLQSATRPSFWKRMERVKNVRRYCIENPPTKRILVQSGAPPHGSS
jgi:hypothetical protein